MKAVLIGLVLSFCSLSAFANSYIGSFELPSAVKCKSPAKEYNLKVYVWGSWVTLAGQRTTEAGASALSYNCTRQDSQQEEGFLLYLCYAKTEAITMKFYRSADNKTHASIEELTFDGDVLASAMSCKGDWYYF